MASDEYKVQVYLYDLSQGMARAMSMGLIGKQIDGIWHTGVVIHGYRGGPKEYYYGGGIQVAPAGCTMAGRPMRVIEMGTTQIPQPMLEEFLREIAPRFTPEKYNLFRHNCNNFSDEVCRFLVGQPIPEYITGLPQEFLNTPMGQMILPLISSFESQMRNSGGGAPAFVPWAESGSTAANPGLTSMAAANVLGSSSPSVALPSSSATPTSGAAAVSGASSPSSAAVPKFDDKDGLGNLCAADHPHRSLSLTAVSLTSRPMLSLDDKAKQFHDMLLKQDGVLAGRAATLNSLVLTAAEKSALVELVNHLQSNPRDSQAPAPASVFPVFDRLVTQWPTDLLFPVLALLRLFLIRPQAAEYYVQPEKRSLLHAMLNNCLLSEPEPSASVQLMALCSVSNVFVRAIPGRLIAEDEVVLQVAKKALANKSKVLRVMGANVMYNISLSLPRATTDAVVEALTALHQAAIEEKDSDTLSRMLLALGHLIYCSDEAAALLASLEFPPAASFDARVTNVVTDIHTMLQHALQ